MTNILLCTLGASWAVIPEAYAFLAEERLPLYQNHPQHSQLLSLKNEYQLQAPDEIWICTTQGKQTQESLAQLQQWIQLCPQAPIVRIWQADQTDQLASQDECGKIRELIVRACLKAHQCAAGGQVVLSLAGGRKTMSADLQWAASIFGCRALLHVISADILPEELRSPKPMLLTKALPENLAGLITPLIAGQTTASDLLDITVDDVGPILHNQHYALTLPEPNSVAKFSESLTTLTLELNKREKASSRLFGNFLLDISRTEHHENWRSLYRLPPRRIDRLRTTMLGDQHRSWLISLPKADLHRHLGGCLDVIAQREVAMAIWKSLTPAEQNAALLICNDLLQSREWPWNWPELIKQQGCRSHNSAALLIKASDAQLDHNLWQTTQPRIALKSRHTYGFAAYERPGELTGSALLSHPASIEPYAEAIVKQAIAEGLVYVELRGSPQKYGDGLRFLNQFYQALARLPDKKNLQFRFIITADRRAQESELAQTIEMAVKAKQQLPDFVVGLDLAGDEQQARPEKIVHLFTPAFEHCLPITIHAGEGEAAESIWQAAYHLHADRIGHGLTLSENHNLSQRFRDRNICLELCPTSNREVVGFYDPRYPESENYPHYPLLNLWKKGLPLTLCTDNPGISRTTLADEYLTAAAMCGNKLSQWDVLAIIKQGFVHSFQTGDSKEVLLKQIDAQLYQCLAE